VVFEVQHVAVKISNVEG